MTTSTRFPHHNQLIKENIINMNFNATVLNVSFHIASKCTKLSSYQMGQKPVHAKILSSEHNLSLLRFNVMKLMLFVAKKICSSQN